MELKGKVAVVTGSSRGIGAKIAQTLATQGAKVVVTYKQQSLKAERIVKTIEDRGGQAIAIEMAVENRRQVQKAFQQVVLNFGNIDILVNNAAIAQEKPFEKICDRDWDTMFSINLKGSFICAQECIPGMARSGWGRIINISSIGGQWGGFNQVHYAASKAGLINFTQSLAKIYSASGITSNSIAIGLVATEMSAAELQSSAGKQKINSIPAGRLGTIEDVSEAVGFLASDRAGYITGQTINLNGGMFFG